MKQLIIAGSILGLLAVMIGAFGAHGLKNALSEHAILRYQTGVQYQFYHVIAILITALFHSTTSKNTQWLKYAGLAFIIGIILFSGSLYLYALTGMSKFGMVAPIGGLSFILGWVFLFIFGIKHTR